MATRYDVSEVPLQGGTIAKRCPVRAQLDVLRPCEPLPAGSVVERRIAKGRDWESELTAGLLEANPSATVVAWEDREQRERATLDAMKAGAGLVVGGRLPPDRAGRRVGEPDMLVRAAVGGYRPVDVTYHRTLDPAGGPLPARCSELGDPSWESSEIRGTRRGDGCGTTCCSWPTTSGCSRRPVWPPATAGTGGSPAPRAS